MPSTATVSSKPGRTQTPSGTAAAKVSEGTVQARAPRVWQAVRHQEGWGWVGEDGWEDPPGGEE